MDRRAPGRAVTAAVAAVALAYADVEAQARSPSRSPESTAYIGALLGTGRHPRALAGTCGARDARVTEALAGLGVGMPVGGVEIAARVTARGSWAPVCLHRNVGAPILEGTYDRAEPGSGDFVGTDVRVRYRMGRDGRWAVLIGPGWAWGKDVPYVAGAVLRQWGDGVRWVVELEGTAYRIAWIRRTVEFDSVLGSRRVIAEERFHDWAVGYGIRVGVEVPIGG